MFYFHGKMIFKIIHFKNTLQHEFYFAIQFLSVYRGRLLAVA